MGLVRSKDTKPELTIRHMVHRMGYRFRLHDARLPGNPDLVFPSRGKIIFVHGCFWHRHGKCRNARWPKSKLDFWKPKLEKNRARDQKNRRSLRLLGWKVLILWECQLKDPNKTAERIIEFLEMQ